MSSETRKQKRELRKSNRATRKDAFNKFIEAVKAFKDLDLTQSLDYKTKFMKVWPAIKPTLEFALISKFTGQGFDNAAKELITLGDNIYNSGNVEANKTKFITKLTAIWDKIEMALEIIKIVADEKADAIIDKIIEIGEWLFEKQ
ncbi:MAG: hypothetical protein COZ21_09920 [Bacteroidetes bacterium CG_4_10_14_3_um_filter_31_20]|nr:hypothetical protein [Bacteroidota bacterium]PIX33009.1 MAG: hypothetical protein COZ59_10985 [Bacteroidetes bacterium CG_4_8_14_3_um_filter_31_14]PIY03253.1 MAG: hypothetical protein COZ21_09920 [Bacteroidetes bacterium CG_4_10_14_3_um_filter_31_20]